MKLGYVLVPLGLSYAAWMGALFTPENSQIQQVLEITAIPAEVTTAIGALGGGLILFENKIKRIDEGIGAYGMNLSEDK